MWRYHFKESEEGFALFLGEFLGIVEARKGGKKVEAFWYGHHSDRDRTRQGSSSRFIDTDNELHLKSIQNVRATPTEPPSGTEDQMISE